MAYVTLLLRNESRIKRLCRKDSLSRLAERICRGEGIGQPVEVSLLFSDNARIQELNRIYRQVDRPTDVLSFAQEHLPVSDIRILGDIVISLETVAERCRDDRAAMRAEVRLLFCHGLLHLLGYDHAEASEQRVMLEKQSRYLGITEEEAWHHSPNLSAQQ